MVFFSDKPKLNWHRHDYSDPDAKHKATQAGTKIFIQELKARTFLKYLTSSSFYNIHKYVIIILFLSFSADEVIIRLRGQQLTLPYLNSSGFTKPIFVENKEGLDLNVPYNHFSVQDVEKYVGMSL